MRKTILLIMLTAVFCIAFAGTRPEFKLYTYTPRYGDPISLPKDSMAIASGAIGIMELGGNMRGFAPPYATSIEYDSYNGLFQVISGLYNTSSFVGVYNTYSTDNGNTWAAPALISDAGTWTRNYNALATAPADNYPYVVVQNPGICFTTDALGPGGGGWTGAVQVIDTTSYTAAGPSIAVNYDGSKVIITASDASNGIGINTSSDYGSTWGTYHVPDEFKGDDPGTDILTIGSAKPIWYKGDTLIVFIEAVFNEDSIRSDILGSGPGTATGFGYSISTDAGTTFSPVTMLFDGHALPDIPSINGDTVVFYMDTIPNGSPDSIEFHAYLDPATGLWTDDYDGSIGGGNGFGSWWYWWDAEIYGYKVYAALPFADLFIDYYIDGDLYTFPWQGQSLVFAEIQIHPAGIEEESENKSINATSATTLWFYKDIHDGNILDTLGNTETWLGNMFSANVSITPNGYVYVIYNDYFDTSTGETSIMSVNNHYDYPLTDPEVGILNAGAYEIETAKELELLYGSAIIAHCAFVPNTEDSVYYIKVDLPYILYKANDNKISTISNPTLLFSVQNNILNLSSFAAGQACIDLYDVSGRFENNIFTGTLDKGEHTFTLNKNLSSGVHFVKINMNGRDYYGKVCIIK